MYIFESRYGKRKVIIGTNIAESSITVNDISYIIDLGLEKLPYFDPKNNTDELQLKRASQASAAQRAGREYSRIPQHNMVSRDGR